MRKPQAQRNTRKPPAAPEPAASVEPRRPRARPKLRPGAWRDRHVHDFLASLGRLAARPWASALTVLMLGFALALPLLFYVAFDNARTLTGDLGEAREITVFLKPSADAKTADAFAAELRGLPSIESVRIRTPDQGLAELRRLSGFGEALDVLDGNPLPSVLIVTPRSVPADGAPPLVGTLEHDARVDLVQYDAAWRRRLADILAFGERAVVVTAILLALVALLVIGNVVRADVQGRAEEIAVLQLIGASSGFVRRPFLYSGFWYGLLGGGVALVVVVAAGIAIAAPLNRLLASYDHAIALHGPGIGVVLAVVGASALLGWAGAFLATARHIAAGHPQ